MSRVYGWKPDLPDLRDHLFSVVRRAPIELPPRVDLRPGCSRVEDQGEIGSCTAQALVGCLEYLEVEQTKSWVDLSRLYLYYQERVHENSIDIDQGACIRTGIKILAKIGVPHESLWPYDQKKWNKKPLPAQEIFNDARKHRIADYQRLNSLLDMRSCLASGYPFVFGFSVYESFESEKVSKTGIVPVPGKTERPNGGHAVMCVGYDDEKQHLIIRNSWGVGWGDKGYCYMPYEFVTNRYLSSDFWTIRKTI